MTCPHLFAPDDPHCVRCYERRDATDTDFPEALALAVGLLDDRPTGTVPVGPWTPGDAA